MGHLWIYGLPRVMWEKDPQHELFHVVSNSREARATVQGFQGGRRDPRNSKMCNAEP